MNAFKKLVTSPLKQVHSSVSRAYSSTTPAAAAAQPVKKNVMEYITEQQIEQRNAMGIDTSFTLRNIVMRVGVEQRYSLYSPLLHSIKVLQQPNEMKVRRAKLFYLRDQPGKVFQPLQALWRQEQASKSTTTSKK
ncbi:unnamed protein product [Absidia cylindrospora]